MRRLLIGSLLGLLLLLPLLLLALVATEAGSRWTVQTGTHLVPGMAVAGVQGTLLSAITLSDISYRDETGLQARLDTLVMDWLPLGLLDGRLQLRAVEASGLLLTLPPPQPQAGEQYPVHLPQRIELPVSVQLGLLSVQQALVSQGQQQWQIERLQLSGRLDREGLQLDELQFEGEGVQLAASGQAQAEYPYALSLRVDWHVSLPGQPQFAGAGELSGDVHRLSIRQSLGLPQQADINAILMPDLEGGRHRFEVIGEWPELAIAVGEDTLHSQQGRLSLKGEPDAYELALATRMQHPAIGEAVDLEVVGHGDLNQLQVERGRLLALGGETQFGGSLGWSPALVWDVSLQASAIDPGRQWPEWPGTLSLDVAVRGGLAAEKLQVDVDIRQLRGTLRDYPVEARGQLALLDESITVRDMKLRSGNNRAQLDGELMPGLQLSFEIDAGDLKQVAPMLAGSLQGRGSLRGSMADPAVQMNLSGSQLVLAGLHAGKLALAADIDPAHDERSHFKLQGEQLEFEGIQVDALNVTGTGNVGKHQISAQATADDAGMEIRTAGSYVEQQWQGELSLLSMNTVALGRWQLENPVELQAGKAELRMETLCMTKDQARLCASGLRREDGSLHSAGELGGLPLALIKPWLAEDAEIDGVVSGSFKVDGKLAQLQAEAMLQVSPGTLHYRSLDGPELIVEHHDGHASLHYRDDTLLAEFGLGMGDDGRLGGKGSLGPEISGQRALQGELDFGLSDPGPLGALAPQLAGWSGPMSLRGRVGGTLQHPAVQLDGDWQDGTVSVPELGITLSAIQVDMTGDGERIKLQGRAVSGKGQVRLQGEALLDSAAGWPVQLHVVGEDFQVAQRADLEVAVSPDFNVTVKGQATNVTGRLTVPSALIVVADIPAGVVRTSSDEIIVDGEPSPDAAGRPQAHQVTAQLHLVLGKDVRLKAYGLDTRLAGELDLHQVPDSPAEAFGQLQLLEGKYKGYGQNLSIEQGRLLFSGPLIAADINVRAVRKVERVTAGILLTGPLTEPTTQLFSEPAMEEAEILSYLLTGGPLSAGSGVNAAALTQAAASLGLDKANTIAGQITGSLGLDELSIGGGGDGQEGSAMAIGKRLSPELYVRYIYGLFDGAATLQLRYKLSEHLRVEVGTGTQQSADVLYEIERE
jgi:translocation and assembly module TamB